MLLCIAKDQKLQRTSLPHRPAGSPSTAHAPSLCFTVHADESVPQSDQEIALACVTNLINDTKLHEGLVAAGLHEMLKEQWPGLTGG